MSAGRRDTSRPEVLAYVAALAALAVVSTVAVTGRRVDPPGTPHVATLLVLFPLLLSAEHLFVRFRFRGEISSINLVEAVLAPLLFGFPPAVVVLLAAATPVVVGVVRRNPLVKTAFNAAQWALAAAAGAAVVSLARPDGPGVATFATIALTLAVVGVVNHACFAGVIAVTRRQTPMRVLAELGPTLVVGWSVGAVVNALTGLLFVAAYAGHPASVVLFPLPLVVQHIAYRSYAGARTDRLRLAGLHRAAGALSPPFDLAQVIPDYLREVAEAFEAPAVDLVLEAAGGLDVHSFRAGAAPTYSRRHAVPDGGSLEAAVLGVEAPARIGGGHPLADVLVAAGWRTCLVAPLRAEAEAMGALLVLDQEGLEGFEEGEIAVIEAFARETAASLRGGELVASVVEERQKLAEIVNSTSDGMCTVDAEGRVRAWNPAWERISGLAAADVVGRLLPVDALRIRAEDGEPVSTTAAAWPERVRITSTSGREVRLSCSSSAARVGTDAVNVVVARDVTPVEEVAKLREQVDELAAAEAVHRSVVERLQEALTPPPPTVAGADLAVTFQASDPTSPTGGDLYDWQVLPSGELHLTVVDVLGHGVSATRDALAVISALRILALQDCPLASLIQRADEVLAAGEREVVATVVIARYDPRTGRVQIASGGHPPAIVLSPSGRARQLAAPGCAIGWPHAGSLQLVDTRLEPGDALVLYTDGLVEARKDILEGLEVLVAAAEAAPATAGARELADLLLARCLDGAARSDDSLVLVMRAAADRASAGWRRPCDDGEASRLRRECLRWLEEHHVDPDVAHDVTLVASELLANAVRAARSEVSLDITMIGPWVTLEVGDDGIGDLPGLEMIALAHPDAESGRGLAIVGSLAERLDVRRQGARTVVRATVRAAAADRSPVIDARRVDVTEES
jgi:PAS domain S-box-containing protein